MVHELKIPSYDYGKVVAGSKTFVVTTNDRGFVVGDYVILKELEDKEFTGANSLCKITYILKSSEFFQEGYVAFSFRLYDTEKSRSRWR